MKIALQFTQDILEEELPELKPPGQEVLYVAVALYFACNVIALVIFAFFTGSASLPSYLLALLIFNALSYGVGRLLEGPSSEVGHHVMDRGSHFARMTGGGRQAGGALGVMGMALILMQFLFFGVYTCVEQFREGLNRRGDNRLQIAAALIKYIIEEGPATVSRVTQELGNAGIDEQQAAGIIDFLKDKTFLHVDQDENLALTVPAQRMFPTQP